MDTRREFAATVTRQGQVTVPAALRRQLGVDRGGRVRFVSGDDGIRLEPEPPIADLFGVFPALPGASDDFDQEIADAVADAVDRKLVRGCGR